MSRVPAAWRELAGRLGERAGGAKVSPRLVYAFHSYILIGTFIHCSSLWTPAFASSGARSPLASATLHWRTAGHISQRADPSRNTSALRRSKRMYVFLAAVDSLCEAYLWLDQYLYRAFCCRPRQHKVLQGVCGDREDDGALRPPRIRAAQWRRPHSSRREVSWLDARRFILLTRFSGTRTRTMR